MESGVYIPSYPLSQYISCFWAEVGHTPYLREKVLPSGYMELIINFGAPHCVFEQGGREEPRLYRESWLSGFQTRPLQIGAVEETCLMGVRFKAGGASVFFDCPAWELSDQVIDLSDVWGACADEMREMLWELDSRDARFARLEELLRGRLGMRSPRWRLVYAAMEHLALRQQPLGIRALSEKLGVSQQHLARSTREIVGVSPKRFAQIARFNRVLHAIDPLQPGSLCALAHDHGYSDQSHLNKDFAAFAGLSPSTYLDQRSTWFGDALCQGFGVHFVPLGSFLTRRR